MATIVNNPAPVNEGSGMGFFLGALVLIVFLVLLFIYGLPMLRNATQGPTINVPDQIDVNVNGGNGGGQ